MTLERFLSVGVTVVQDNDRPVTASNIGTVLYAAFMFKENGNITTEQTCTDKLQTFHKCKKFMGSPLKAANMDIPGASELGNIDFDPRPEKFRNDKNYQSYFINFPGSPKMPIFQTFTPANNQAVFNDHDYLKLHPADQYLEDIHMTKITQHEVKSIEERTVGQSLNPQWKEERIKRLPSSMFGRICKATQIGQINENWQNRYNK